MVLITPKRWRMHTPLKCTHRARAHTHTGGRLWAVKSTRCIVRAAWDENHHRHATVHGPGGHANAAAGVLVLVGVMRARALALSLSLSLSLFRSHTHTHTHTHSLSLFLSLSFFLSRSPTHSLTHTHSLSLSLSLCGLCWHVCGPQVCPSQKLELHVPYIIIYLGK